MQLFNIVVSFALAVLAGLGVGSGGLYIIFLHDILHLPHEAAKNGNLLFFVTALLSAVVIHIRQKRLDYPFLAQILLFGIPGAYIGYLLSEYLPVRVLRVALGIFLILSGVLSFFINKRKSGESKREK
ncbi:MAG: sulfite exporter TauE/SafE family protein [Clostridia bacterium]|nr:sulfite exporter TauE/SafE family protein [Clostridia bacterium]